MSVKTSARPSRRLRQLMVCAPEQPNNPDVHLRVAHTLDRLGRAREAQDEYERAAELFLAQGWLKKALAVYLILRERAPEDQTILAGCAEVARRLAESEESSARAAFRPVFDGDERRASPRVAWPDNVMIWGIAVGRSPFLGNRVFAVQGRDVSAGGLAGAASMGPAAGSDVELTVQLPSLRRPGHIRSHVVRPTTEGGSIGLRFDGADPDVLGYLIATVARAHDLTPSDVRALRETVLECSA